MKITTKITTFSSFFFSFIMFANGIGKVMNSCTFDCSCEREKRNEGGKKKKKRAKRYCGGGRRGVGGHGRASKEKEAKEVKNK
jgi:hypothetical protein